MRDCVRLMLGVAVVAAIAISAGRANAEDPNAAPNPYRVVENWAKLPEGRVWGQAIGVDIDRDGYARCYPLEIEELKVRERYAVTQIQSRRDELDGPLRPTARLSAIGTFARSTHARQANRFAERPEFCDQYARDRGSAETVPSSSRRALPGRKLQFTNPFISSPTTKTP